MIMHVSNISAAVATIFIHVPPPRRWCDGMTSEQIIAEIREMLRNMPDLPFNPKTAHIELPAFITGREAAR